VTSSREKLWQGIASTEKAMGLEFNDPDRGLFLENCKVEPHELNFGYPEIMMTKPSFMLDRNLSPSLTLNIRRP
jgi:hypothetical protein